LIRPATDSVVAAHHVSGGGVFFMAGGAGATIRAAVVLASEEEAVGPTVVEPHWVLGKAVGVNRERQDLFEG
jgi:hypothetical protein